MQAHEFLKGDLRRVEPDFRYACRWLMKQLGYRNAPVWFWCKKPDLRESGWAQKADFDLHDYHWPKDRDFIEQSWSRLFAREKFDEDWIGKEAYWQGTAERLYLHEVKSIRPFIAR